MLGHAVPLLRDPLAFLRGLPRTGDLVRVRVGPLRAVVVCDAELTRQVMRNDRVFDKGGVLYEQGREIAGDGLTTCPHARHRRQRRMLQPAFRPARLADHGAVIAAEIHAEVSRWRPGEVLNIPARMLTLSTTIAVRTLLSADLSAEETRAAIDDLTTVLTGAARAVLTPPALRGFTGNGRYRRARERLRHRLGVIVAEHRANGTEGSGALLDALLNTPEITDGEISDQVMTFFFAASETTASAVAWALFLLAGDDRARRRWHAESAAVLAGRPVGRAHLDGLTFTGWVVAEALRLYPPVWLVTRNLTEDTELGGHRLPAGTTVVCSPYLIHRTDFVRPDRFDPDRWRDNPTHAALPFGLGARRCIGDQFALAQATMTLAAIGARWRLEPVARARPAAGLSLRPRGLLMRATEPTV